MTLSGPASSAPIPIGCMIPLTGPSAADGAEFRNGIILAVDEINARGGLLGRSIKPIFADTGPQSAEDVVAAASWLIQRHDVHAIINGYNIGPQNSEYEPIADAGIIYIHANTLLQHHDTVLSDPDRYFGCFMVDPADYWYGPGFLKFISWLRDTGQWRPPSNRLAIISGSKPYSIVIAQAMVSSAANFGWRVCFGPEIVQTPTSDWREVLVAMRSCEPAVVANTHYYSGDLASFQLQFMEKPSNSLVYLQYGAMHQSFSDIAQAKGVGVVTSTVIGLLRDEIGQRFASRYIARFGEGSTPHIGCQSYSALHHYALAASVANGTAGPGGAAQNRKVAQALKAIVYRSPSGAIRFDAGSQAAVPYPVVTQDPSLGMPHLFFQIRSNMRQHALVAPEPFNTDRFVLPPWMNAGI